MQLNNSSNNNPIRPQNLSCPASGTYSAKDKPTDSDCSQRGVIVAPPSGNTDNPDNLTVLHRGFDTIALSIQSNIGPELFAFLEAEQERAEQEKRDVLVDYNGVQLHLKGHGGHGYKFIASGGPDGATWFFKKPNSKDKWGIRLSFGSFFLAMHGLGAAKSHCEHVLGRLGVRYKPEDVSIARVDVCVDILAPNFEVIPDHFVMHSATGRRDYVTNEDYSVNGKSGRVTSVTIGSTRNRQVIVYDKRAEVIAHSKSYWWDIWNDTLRRQICKTEALYHNALSPNADDAENNRVWRVEIRAGKDLLKDRWGIRTWEQLFDCFGDLCTEAGELVRYTEPTAGDVNRARWPNHPLWEIACAEINDGLFEMRSGLAPNPMKEVQRAEHINLIYRNVLGCSITLAALNGKSFDELPQSLSDLSEQMKASVKGDPMKTNKQLQDASERYVFIQTPQNPYT